MQKILADYIAKYKPLIDKGITDELDRRMREVVAIAPQLGEIVSAMGELSIGGKRLRALLTLIGYQLAGGSPANEAVAIKAGVAMEIFHLGLLIHDDIMDQDSLRRGVTTIHARYDNKHLGESLAILAGDYAYAWTSTILTDLELSPERVIAGLAVWNKYFSRVGYGQTLDVWTESRGEVTEGEILSVLSLKSGEYTCVLPLLLGASLGNANQEQLDRLEQYGMELGWVFQLRDDYLAEYGDSEKTGKPVGNDSREGKRTIVTLYGKEKSESEMAIHMRAGSELSRDDELLGAIIEYVGTRDN